MTRAVDDEAASSSARHHRAAAGLVVRAAIITVSDTRTPADDESGGILRAALSGAGHRVAEYAVVPDEPQRLAPLLEAWLGRDDIDAVLLNGGTGIARRDRTFDVVEARLEKHLPGFGELFRLLSFEQVGAAAMLSRATAGVCAGKIVFSLPGSPQAVTLAAERLILPELAHLVWELRR
jgi:molybdenum cofactor biosynthesis protein B